MSDNSIEHKNNVPPLPKGTVTMLPLSLIEQNDGQLPGLPKNPRSIKKKKFEKLKANIEAYPEMLGWRCLLVYPLGNGKYILIGGNMRYRAMSELGHADAPCMVIPKETPVERLQAYTIIDNNGFGDWDWNLLADEWQDDWLADWGLDIPTQGEKKDLSDQIGQSYKIEIDCADEAEQELLYNTLIDQGYSCRVLTL